jgi:hypothetical protein
VNRAVPVIEDGQLVYVIPGLGDWHGPVDPGALRSYWRETGDLRALAVLRRVEEDTARWRRRRRDRKWDVRTVPPE